MRRVTLLLMLWAGAGCSALSPSATITYRVTGAGTDKAASITFNGPDGAGMQEADAVLPWTRSFTVDKSDDFLYVSAQNDNDSGCITVQILDGEDVMYTAQSCGAFVIATASGYHK